MSDTKVDPYSQLSDILREQHVFSLVCLDQNQAWTCSCFFAPGPDTTLVFASDPASRHGRMLAKNPVAWANLYLGESDVSQIRGLQLAGVCEQLSRIPEESYKANLAEIYTNRFPFAREQTPLTLWGFQINYAKITDNRIRFGYKAEWRRANDSGN